MGSGGGAGWGEDEDIGFCHVDVKLGGEAETVESIKLALQAGRGCADVREVVGMEEGGHSQGSKCGGGGVGSFKERGNSIDVETKEEGAEGVASFDA